MNGTLATGTLKRDAFSKGPMNKMDLNEFIERSANGDMYVLVTTIEYPNGLLRGQVVPVNSAPSPSAAAPGPQPGPGPVSAPEPRPIAAPTPGT